MNDLTPTIGVGVGDLQMAATREVRRIMRQAKGDRSAAVKLVLERVHELGYIKENDLKSLQRITELGFSSSAGKISADKAYSEVRRIYDEMLAGGKSSPTALVIASASAGSYLGEANVDGKPTIVAAKAGSNWQGTLAGAGAIIGGALGGAAGAAIGGAIGGVAGKIVDECKE